jgi:hypothetical protein
VFSVGSEVILVQNDENHRLETLTACNRPEEKEMGSDEEIWLKIRSFEAYENFKGNHSKGFFKIIRNLPRKAW